jgi:Pyruvate/2-oxoacid:ferredoxin oxidoreductase delta subunit
MSDDVYRQLCETMAKRGGRYPGMDIPEFYEMAKELFTPEEAAVFNAIPRGFSPAGVTAEAMGKSEEDIIPILEAMASKGLCAAGEMGESKFYGSLPFVPGIFEFQFMRGTSTEKDKKLARLIHAYKEAYDAAQGGEPEITYPTMRVITIEETIKPGNTVHTYGKLASLIENYDPIAVGTCFCRHEAELIDENDRCDMPNEVCMQFGMAAQFTIDRGITRKISKEEALEILKKSEEAGLVHCGPNNQQDIDFLCNCCSCHCMIIKSALAQPKPGLALNSGFKPVWDADLCTACETCIDRCPMSALKMGSKDVPEVNLDRCIGCGVCATGCPEEAISLVQRTEIPVPPVDRKALKEAIKSSRS